MAVTVLLVGAFDTKGPEYAFLRERILADGIDVLTLNTGVLGSTELFPVDIEAVREPPVVPPWRHWHAQNRSMGEAEAYNASTVATLHGFHPMFDVTAQQADVM